MAILGSTGSLGRQALEVCEWFADTHRPVALAAGGNIRLLHDQIRRWKPEVVAVYRRSAARQLRQWLHAEGSTVKVLEGGEGLVEVARWENAEVVLVLVSGLAALAPLVAALRTGKKVGVGNKEALVAGGPALRQLLKTAPGALVPVDGEHSAIFQCLMGRRHEVDHVVLTASGGPFRDWDVGQLQRATPEEALAHPNWNMGPKISVDAATLMNKGLEIIEAMQLFDLRLDQVRVVVHRESVVHALVGLRDGTYLAQLGLPDMRVPLAYALTHPQRRELPIGRLRLEELGRLSFEPPDPDRFPCLQLARRAAELGGSAPAVLCGADEVAVRAFLDGRISFLAIARIISRVLEEHVIMKHPTLDQVAEHYRWAMHRAEQLVKEGDEEVRPCRPC